MKGSRLMWVSCMDRYCCDGRRTKPQQLHSFLFLRSYWGRLMDRSPPSWQAGRHSAHRCRLHTCKIFSEYKDQSFASFPSIRWRSSSQLCYKTQRLVRPTSLTILLCLKRNRYKASLANAKKARPELWGCHYQSILKFRLREGSWLCSILIDAYLYSELLHYHAGIPPAEDQVVMLAFAAFIIGHILDNPQYPHSKVLEHLNSLDHIDEWQSLRCSDNDGSIKF